MDTEKPHGRIAATITAEVNQQVAGEIGINQVDQVTRTVGRGIFFKISRRLFKDCCD